MILQYYFGLFIFIGSVLSFSCSDKHLSGFDFEKIKGTYAVTVLHDTPPTQTNNTWLIGICDSIDEKYEECPKHSDICGITRINKKKDSLDDSFVSEIIGISSNFQKKYKTADKKDKQLPRIEISYDSVNWGDSLIDGKISFYCHDDDKSKAQNELIFDSWDGNSVSLSMWTNAVCSQGSGSHPPGNKKNDKTKDDKKEDRGEGWGWFTWIFVFLVLFLSIHIIGGAFFQYYKGESIDFRSAVIEVLENLFTILKGLPDFIKEIIERFTGSSNRGEYSAV